VDTPWCNSQCVTAERMMGSAMTWCVIQVSAPPPADGYKNIPRGKARRLRWVLTAPEDGRDGRVCLQACAARPAFMRRWRFFEGGSVDGGRLELEEFWFRRASRASRRLRRMSTNTRTLNGVCCQSSAEMPSSSGRGAGSSTSLTMRSPLTS
jgi:hypothetical protein